MSDEMGTAPETMDGAEQSDQVEPAEEETHANGNLDDVDPEEVERIRQERLDPENRPDNVEVDNTDREFDAQKGLFTDTDGYEESPTRFPPPEEQNL